jgi:hypothetical protein
MQVNTEYYEEYETRPASEDHAKELVPSTMQGLSRLAYSGSYWLSYGVVYATVFVAHSLPQENPVMHGLRDGASAAIDALKSEE